MRPDDPSRPLLGLHIPKCAGSSTKQVLRTWFGWRMHWHYFDERRNRMPSQPKLPRTLLGALARRGRCIYGHFNRARGFGVENHHPDADQFFTVVRDPLRTHHVERPYFIHYLPGPMTMNTYRAVFETRFVYVGIAEEMQSSLDHLAARLGIASVPAPHVNVSHHDETLDPALAAAFEPSRPLKYAVYHDALEHYRDEPVT